VLSEITETDITWTFVDAGIWTSVEPAIAVVSACLPILRSLWVWKKKRSQAKSTNTLKTVSRSPRQSLKPFPRSQEKRRTGSFTSRYPINELPAEMDNNWGTTTEIYSPMSHSRKSSKHDDHDISLHDLPIQKQDHDSIEETPPISPVKKDSPHLKSIAELYG
jgi:hypothetical protein